MMMLRQSGSTGMILRAAHVYCLGLCLGLGSFLVAANLEAKPFVMATSNGTRDTSYFINAVSSGGEAHVEACWHGRASLLSPVARIQSTPRDYAQMCRSGKRLFVGGVFNVAPSSDGVAHNFGYIDYSRGEWVSPPVTIGENPTNLLFNPNITSSDSQGQGMAGRVVYW
jgi:hypothetical protein